MVHLNDCMPLAVLGLVSIALLLQCALFRSRLGSFWISLIGYGCSGFFFLKASKEAPIQIGQLFVLDSYGCFFALLIIAASAVIAIFSYEYFKKSSYAVEEFFLFLSLSTGGAVAMTIATHFVSFFLGLEILTVTLYAMIVYKKESIMGIEAALKYLVLAGVASAFLLFGFALLYFETGTLTIGSSLKEATSLLSRTALAMIFVGIGFKLAIVPFYLWTPDIYQGAITPVTAFIATVSKGSALVFLSRFVAEMNPSVLPIVGLFAIASMIVGNLLALFQENLKRLLAYSSIAHVGYILVTLLSSEAWAGGALALYLTAYFIATLGIFGILCLFSDHKEEEGLLSSYKGLAWDHPLYATIFSLMLFSLVGLPLTVGFMGKFFILRAAISSQLYLLVVILILTSVVGLFYYLRVISTLFAKEDRKVRVPACLCTTITLIGLSTLLVYLGLWPTG